MYNFFYLFFILFPSIKKNKSFFDQTDQTLIIKFIKVKKSLKNKLFFFPLTANLQRNSFHLSFEENLIFPADFIKIKNWKEKKTNFYPINQSKRKLFKDFLLFLVHFSLL